MCTWAGLRSRSRLLAASSLSSRDQQRDGAMDACNTCPVAHLAPPIADVWEYVFVEAWAASASFALGLSVGLGAECFHKRRSAPTAEALGAGQPRCLRT